MDAIRGRSVDGIEISFDFLYAKGTMEGQRMGDRALFTVRSNDANVPNLLKGPAENDNSF
jgi:hypothetical protein